MRLITGVPGAMLALLGPAAPISVEDPPATPPSSIEFSVLTPGMQGKYFVYTGIDVLTFLGIGGHADKLRTNVLRELVAGEAYDISPRLASGIITALHEAGRTAADEPIPRRPAGKLQSLSLSDLPENPHGALLLDVTIQWVGLRAAANGDPFRPVLSLTWRLISPRGELVAPGRELVYVHEPSTFKAIGTATAAAPIPRPAPGTPITAVSAEQTCAFHSFRQVENDPEALWNCMDEAYLEVGRRLVMALDSAGQ